MRLILFLALAPLVAIAGEKPDKLDQCRDLIVKTDPKHYSYQVSQCVSNKRGSCDHADKRLECVSKAITSCALASLKSQISMVKKLRKYQCLELALAGMLEEPEDQKEDSEL